MFLLVLLHILQSAVSTRSCPSLCVCSSGVTEPRSVQCSDPGTSALPVNVPADTVKLRLEKTSITRVPRAAFYNLSELRFLWLTYNSITSVHPSSFVNLKALRELRLDGNLLTAFPWEGLRDTPRLQTLGLHNNRLSSLPAHAALFLPNITYLDLSSNKLTILPAELLDLWFPLPELQEGPVQRKILGKYVRPSNTSAVLRTPVELLGSAAIKTITADKDAPGWVFSRRTPTTDFMHSFKQSEKVQPLLGSLSIQLTTGGLQRAGRCLHDNPWLCDCQISMLTSLSASVGSPVVLMDQLLMCSRSVGRSGLLLTQAELSRCMRPSVQPAATRVVSPLGSNVILRCDASGYPTPTLTWIKTSAYTGCCQQDLLQSSEQLPRILDTFLQESPRVGVRWSIISLNGLSYKDAGEYRCQARNMAGISEAPIKLRVMGIARLSGVPKKKSQKTLTKSSPKYRKPPRPPASNSLKGKATTSGPPSLQNNTQEV
ncbi:leucine-rich repeat, immunoglobulin-like domain and transmembrane domain-containing protein 3b [Fundulus diaphanus]